MAIGTTIDGLNAVTSLTTNDEVPVWDKEASGEPTKKITGSNLASSVKTLGSLLGMSDVVDSLIRDATKVPSAECVYDQIVSQSVNTGITGVSAYKAGNVVTLIIQMGTTSAATSAGWFSLGVLPASLKPPITINFLGYDNRYDHPDSERSFQISTAGNLYVALANGESCQPRAIVTYIVA